MYAFRGCVHLDYKITISQLLPAPSIIPAVTCDSQKGDADVQALWWSETI